MKNLSNKELMEFNGGSTFPIWWLEPLADYFFGEPKEEVGSCIGNH